MGIYPKKKKVLKAASGLNAQQIDQLDNSVIAGANAIPGYGQAISAGLGIAKELGSAIEGDGTSGAKNAAAGAINPLSTVNALASGRFKEAIPVLGGFQKAKRLRAEQKKAEQQRQAQEADHLQKESNRVYGQLTYKDGGAMVDESQGDEYVQAMAVVLDGKSHEEGGNDVIDANTGEKVAETESQELLFSRKQTEEIESHIAMYDKTKGVEHLLELGKIVKNIVDNEMIDYSGKFS